MSPANFDTLNRFILTDYTERQPFAGFLPGIAGLQGIPMWVFYVNRGQCIAGFGIESKDHPLMEFQPANRAYQSVPALGFRTFLKGQRDRQSWYHEPFSPWVNHTARHTLLLGLNEVEIRETCPDLGLQVDVLYFILPGEPFAGLARRVTIHNLAPSPLTLEVLDGLPVLMPYGVDNDGLKQFGRTIEAWMEVTGHEERLPFYRLKATFRDTASVDAIEAANYALAFLDEKSLPVAVDPAAVFGAGTDLAFPRPFRDSGLRAVMEARQVTQGRTPCALFGASLELAAGEARTITGLYGYAEQPAVLAAHLPVLLAPGYIEGKLSEARQLTSHLTDAIRTESASPLFDAYCRQTYLDNGMRGGVPLLLGQKHIYHVYSRKHGDLERDYNHFVLAPEFYSQGNGNYRDINQNRRNDVFFLPQAGEFNIRLFVSLIQADGYNPLVIEGTAFSLPIEEQADLLRQAGNPAPLARLFDRQFTPGQLLAATQDADLKIAPGDFLEQVFGRARQHIRAAHGEGFWIDHWTYNLDLIETYLAIYPDRKTALLFDSEPLPFFDNATYVRPRRERFVLTDQGPRQLNAIGYDKRKAALIAARTEQACWARSRRGQGEVFCLPLFSKLALLALVKFASLDPSGYGIQMEAGKPGWYDALNGLPALFGSSMPETFELLRLIDFLLATLTESPREVELPVEAVDLLRVVRSVLRQEPAPLRAWERLSSGLEAYRRSVHLGFDGAVERIPLTGDLQAMRLRLLAGIENAMRAGDGLPPTYFIHIARDYIPTAKTDPQGRPFLRIKSFEARPLPPFLEGPVRQMRLLDSDQAARLHARLRASDLFDRELGMYRVNTNLDALPQTIGRARAFPRGWLENESIWMHMAFKYLLELLRAGLYPEFFADLQKSLPAFMDPAVYGRSPLENSSFIVSSVHPDKSLHGNGFVARLSGSTAEFLSLWTRMTAGPRPFRLQGDDLILELNPALPGWLFKEDGTFGFRFLGCCDVTYHNPTRVDTFGKVKVKETILRLVGGETLAFPGRIVPAPYAQALRAGKVAALDMYFEAS